MVDDSRMADGHQPFSTYMCQQVREEIYYLLLVRTILAKNASRQEGSLWTHFTGEECKLKNTFPGTEVSCIQRILFFPHLDF